MNKIKVKIHSNDFDIDNCSNWRSNLQYNGEIEDVEITFYKSHVYYFEDDLNYDVIVFIRPLLGYAEYIKNLKNAGKKVIVDFDDPLPMVFDKSLVKENIIQTLSIFDSCDLVTTTNESMKTYFYYHTYKDKIEILPNVINKKFVNKNKKNNSDKIILGWFGNGGHISSLQQINNIILKILNENENVFLNIYSDNNNIFEIFNHPKTNKINYVHNFEIFQDSLNDIDINLAPLDENYFNLNKSNIRIILPGYKGIPSIATNFGEYKKIGKDNILLCDSVEDWYDNLMLLINDSNLRKNMGHNIQKYVEEYFSFEKWSTIKSEMFKNLINKN
jgi:glycosyltransferase involved in cell wall biosynthesis